MKSLIVAGWVGVFVLGLAASGALAQDVPWKSTDPAPVPPTGTVTPVGTGAVTVTSTGSVTTTTTASTTTPATDIGTPKPVFDTPPAAAAASLANDPKFATVVKPIEEQIAMAEKVQGLYDKEMAKPEKARNLQLLSDYKQRIYRAYLAGALKAKAVGAQFKDKADQQLVADTYEKPLRAKAIAIQLELADAAMAKKDYRTAYSIYQEVLKIDPENQAAKDGVKQIQDAVKAASGTPPTTPGGGGSTNPPKSWEQPKPYQTQPYDKSWKTY
jgi:hypothetical protein